MLSTVFACRMHYETMSKRRPTWQNMLDGNCRKSLLFASATHSNCLLARANKISHIQPRSGQSVVE